MDHWNTSSIETQRRIITAAIAHLERLQAKEGNTFPPNDKKALLLARNILYDLYIGKYKSHDV